MSPIQVPDDWDDNGILLFEEFCNFIRTPQRTVRDWKQRRIGPRWWKFNGNGRLYTTVAELRRFLEFWQRELDGPLRAVTVAHKRLIRSGEYRSVTTELRLH